MLSSVHEDRLTWARISLEGLSVGDALGGFFEFRSLGDVIKTRKLPDVTWHFTDDTNMALSIYAILRRYQVIDQDKLAVDFAQHFDRLRGYGMGARHILTKIRDSGNWRELCRTIFRGEGSFGNGGAMRVAPLGAYFADDIAAVVKNAGLSAEITHAHPEGISGAVAIAVAAAVACRLKGSNPPTRKEFIDLILPYLSDSEVKSGVVKSRDLPSSMPIEEVVAALGNGRRVSAQDTVPFALWCAGESLANYEEAIWLTASGGGDVDTTCAIVGGIVVCYTGVEAIPSSWMNHREPLPYWAFDE